MRWLLLTFLILSALEIGAFIMAGNLIGPWWVVILIILTGVLGVSIAKKQGFEIWKKAQRSMENGRVPTNEIMDGICIFVGAILLFTPGFITDTIGFLLVIPATRNPFKMILSKIIKQFVNKSTIIFKKW